MNDKVMVTSIESCGYRAAHIIIYSLVVAIKEVATPP